VHVKKILKTGVREHGQRLKKVLWFTCSQDNSS
jgi:hypothetical protein